MSTPDLPDYTKRMILIYNPDLPENPSIVEDALEVSEDPVEVDPRIDLGRNSRDGYIACDGPGYLEVSFSHNGTDWSARATVLEGEILSLDGLNIALMRLWALESTTDVRILMV